MVESESQEALQSLGLSKYAAQTLIGLQKIGHGTASDVAAVTDVPRSQVYGAADELETLGLVSSRDADPKEFKAVSPEEAGEIFRTRLEQQTTEAVTNLRAVRRTAAGQPAEEEAVWRTQGVKSITQQIQRLMQTANGQITYYFSTPDQFPSNLQELLEEESESDIDVEVLTTEGVLADLSIDTASFQNTGIELIDSLSENTVPCTRILIVDRSTIAIGVESQMRTTDEICFWSANTQIATVLAAVFHVFFSPDSRVEN